MKTGKMDQKGPLEQQAFSQPNNPGSADRRIADYFASDLQFHKLYPDSLLHQANMHWTPLHVARKAAAFLAVGDNPRILDIGSGAGKFCITAAYYYPGAAYTGIEQREDLIAAANKARDLLRLQQVEFICGNLLQLDLSGYDHFYFFNAFFENLEESFRIDQSVPYSRELYAKYNRYLFRQLQDKPAGTRLVTYHSTETEIPGDYHEVGDAEEGLLKCWMKV